MVMQISAALLSQSFYSGKSYVKKISVYFLAICTNLPCKIKKFELEVKGVGNILLSRQPLTYLIGKSQLKE